MEGRSAHQACVLKPWKRAADSNRSSPPTSGNERLLWSPPPAGGYADPAPSSSRRLARPGRFYLGWCAGNDPPELAQQSSRVSVEAGGDRDLRGKSGDPGPGLSSSRSTGSWNTSRRSPAGFDEVSRAGRDGAGELAGGGTWPLGRERRTAGHHTSWDQSMTMDWHHQLDERQAPARPPAAPPWQIISSSVVSCGTGPRCWPSSRAGRPHSRTSTTAFPQYMEGLVE